MYRCAQFHQDPVPQPDVSSRHLAHLSPSTPWHIPPRHKFIDGWDAWCWGANGRILLTEALEPNCNQIFMELLRAVKPWDAGWTTTSRPLRLGIFCVKGKHRSFSKMLLAAAALEHMWFTVSTEAPCTDPCGCGGDGFCWHLSGKYPASQRKAVAYSHAMEANLAKRIAISTSAITLAIIL